MLIRICAHACVYACVCICVYVGYLCVCSEENEFVDDLCVFVDEHTHVYASMCVCMRYNRILMHMHVFAFV